ncbi:alpha/beta hydrolase family protein [Actinoplanes sp. GCM10030250]|uniref:alpha/beta hydrolase family protein n=1 Tax=Actinoplanes sp. GCM10030250 TaxID=3273376 RepID=UPI00360B6272
MACAAVGVTAAAALSAPAAAALNGTALSEPAADPGGRLELPAPTGPFRVGVTDLHLVDRSRADLWAPERRRELMVSLWYPAAGRHGRPDQYVSAEESRLILERLGASELPPAVLSSVRTHARTGLDALPQHRGWPLVVLSPGFSFPRSSLTSLAEDLASRGYVVAGVDHTYEAAAVTFPDGRVTTCVVCDLVDADQVEPAQVTAGRVKDLSFVLDELTGPRAKDDPVGESRAKENRVKGIPIDTGRVIVAGHSLGGDAAGWTVLSDRRFDAGINMDGSFHPAITSAVDRPVLLLGAGDEHGRPGTDASWDETWQHLTGWRRWITVTDTTHSSFTDYAVLGDQVGLPVQPLPGERAVEITRAYVGAFADRHLRHTPERLLNGPSNRYPEAVHWHP